VDASQESRSGRRTWGGRGLAIAILLLSCATAYWLGASGNNHRPQNAGLRVAEERLQFGTVWEGQSFEWTLPIENPTGTDIEILDWATSCTCLAVKPRTLVVPGRGVSNVVLTIDVPNSRPRESESTLRNLEVGIRPLIRTRLPGQGGWTVHGQLRRLLRMNPPAVSFGERLVRGTPFSAEKVMVTSEIPLERLDVKCPASYASVDREPIDGANKYMVALHPQESLLAGHFQFDIVLQAVPQDGATVPPVRLHVDGTVMEDVQSSPRALWFGARPVGSGCSETVILRSSSGRAFQVEGVETSSPSIAVAQVRSGGEKDWKLFRVTQEIAAPGLHEEEVRFVVKEVGQPLFKVGLPVTHHGVADVRWQRDSMAPHRGQ
jgi:hypothetical protein